MIDVAVSNALQSFQSEWLTGFMRAVSAAGSMRAYFIVVPMMVGFFLWSGRRKMALVTVLVQVGTIFIPIVKGLVDRPRPASDAVSVLAHAPGSSFPSGHALAATIFYGFLIYLVAKSRLHRRRWLIAALAVFIVLVGTSRVYLGVHWPSDVVAGYAIGALWLWIFIRVFHRRREG